MNFTKKDLKSLKLLIDLKAVEETIEQEVKVNFFEWKEDTLDKSVNDDDDIVIEEVTNDEHEIKDRGDSATEKVVIEVDAEKVVTEVDEDSEKKKLRKRYKGLIKSLLEENGGKMKLKKLKKAFVEKSADLEPKSENEREELFVKYIEKVKNVSIDGKYVLMSQ